MGEFVSGFQPQGEPEVIVQNPWFELRRQAMDFVDPVSGVMRKSAEDGGQMNYVTMLPGVAVVADLEGKATVLMPQERHVTNLVYGRSVRHYELPAGGIAADEIGEDGVVDARVLQATAERELAEEAGLQADDYIVLDRGLGAMTHSGMSTHRNYTVLARGAISNGQGALHESTEILGTPEQFTWREADDMYLNPNGLWTPETDKRISSIATIASLGIAQKWLEREREHGVVHIDLKQ